MLIGDDFEAIASGGYDWENRYLNGIWSYELEDVWKGLQSSYQRMAEEVKAKYGVTIQKLAAIGFSGMMHGYLAFNKADELLVPFRTWRNTITGPAAEELTDLFQYNIPQRWSIAHLYQAILNEEEHVSDVNFITTLASYVHWKLTGRKVIGVGEASGMFPIDIDKNDYNEEMIQKFDGLDRCEKYSWKLREVLPEVMVAGQDAGLLTEEGARLLDASGELKAGIPMCPPEGDAGTGMVATNSVAERTGNVSAGTSIFAMIVLEKELSKIYREIDLVTTPAGSLVAMVHANNCTSDLNAWVNLFKEFAESFGMDVDMNQLFGTLYNKALEGDADCGGLLSYGYLSGEGITDIDEGRPLFVRSPESKFNLANFMRVNLFTALGAIKVGMEILIDEKVKIDKILGHGGLFKTKDVGQKVMAAAMEAPVYVMETAGEGGAWGIALLAAYMANKEAGESLDDYLTNKVFADNAGVRMDPDPEDVAGFNTFTERYKKGLPIERAAVEHLV